MKKVILIKNGELALKGLNRSTFEDILVKNLKRRLSPLGKFSFTKAQSTVITEPENEDVDFDAAVECVSHVFGIAAFSVAGVTEKDIESIKKAVTDFLGDELKSVRTFKVCAKRSDKKFPLTSPEICREVGGYVLSRIPSLKVDVHEPELTVTVEVRDSSVFVHGNQLRGAGGMPVGTSGKGLLLLSGGIDSPVAGHMIAKRGMNIECIHFHSYPYTNLQARDKVIELAKVLSEYTCGTKLNIVSVTHIQEEIHKNCNGEYMVTLLRRFMMRIAERIAARCGAQCIITGESLGQVASQTIEGMTSSNSVIKNLPVLRPLCGFDKDEIIERSRSIGAFEISIQPYEDCCTVFLPRHPVIKPTIEAVLAEEQKLNVDSLVEEAIKTLEILNI